MNISHKLSALSSPRLAATSIIELIQGISPGACDKMNQVRQMANDNPVAIITHLLHKSKVATLRGGLRVRLNDRGHWTEHNGKESGGGCSVAYQQRLKAFAINSSVVPTHDA